MTTLKPPQDTTTVAAVRPSRGNFSSLAGWVPVRRGVVSCGVTTARPLAGRWTLAILVPLTVAASVFLGWNTLPQYEKAHGSDYRQTTPAPVGDAGVGREFGDTP